MKNKNKKILILFSVLFLFLVSVDFASAEAIVIDHDSVNLIAIPDSAINEIKEQAKIYYAYTSHGSQLTIGLQSMEDIDFKYNISIGPTLSNESGTLNILDNGGVAASGYWQSESGKQATQNILSQNSGINIAMWSWCFELNSYSHEQVQNYLDSIAGFEDTNPDVTFIYMTGNAQASGAEGYNRYLRNNQIRDWVKNNPNKNRVLFDFAELDSWQIGLSTGQWEQATEQFWNGSEYVEIPIEHPSFQGDIIAHTTYESCEQKGSAMWSMLAEIFGRENVSEEIIEIEEDEIIDDQPEEGDGDDNNDNEEEKNQPLDDRKNIEEDLEDSKDPILYYGSDCSHSKIVKKYVTDNNINIELKEVSQDEDNANELMQKVKTCGLSETIYIPFLWTDEGCLMGDKPILHYFISSELEEINKNYDSETMSIIEDEDGYNEENTADEEDIDGVSSFIAFLKNNNSDGRENESFVSEGQEDQGEIAQTNDNAEDIPQKGLTYWIKDAKMIAIILIGAILIIAIVGYTIKEATN